METGQKDTTPPYGNKMTKRFGAIIQVCINYSIDTGKVQARDIYCLGIRIYRQVIS